MNRPQGPPSNANETLVIELLDGMDSYINLSSTEEVPPEYIDRVRESIRSSGEDIGQVSPEALARVERFFYQASQYFLGTKSQWVIRWAMTHPEGLAATFIYQRVEGYIPEELSPKIIAPQLVRVLDDVITTQSLTVSVERVDTPTISIAVSTLKDLQLTLGLKIENPPQEYLDMATEVVGERPGQEVGIVVIIAIAGLIIQIVTFFMNRKKSQWIMERASSNPHGIIARLFTNRIIGKIPAEVRTRQTAAGILAKAYQKVSQ